MGGALSGDLCPGGGGRLWSYAPPSCGGGAGQGSFSEKGGRVNPPTPPAAAGGAEFADAPKAPKEIFGLNRLAPENVLDWPKARRRFRPNHFNGGEGGRGCSRRGGLKGGGGGWLGPASSLGPPMVPAEGGLKTLKLKSSWHRRRRSTIWLSASNIGRGGGGRGVPPLLLRCTALLIHHWGGGWGVQGGWGGGWWGTPPLRCC